MQRAAAVIGFLILVVLPSAAQTPIEERPAPIAFDAWQRVDSEEGPSEYTVTFPSSTRSGYPENDRVRLRAFLPENRKGAVPVVVVLHYWGASDQKAEVSLANDLLRRGIAAVLMPLPYHLSRTPAGYRSGQLAIQADPKVLVATMSQAVLDVRRTVDWIETRPEFDSRHIGIVGTSLGSLVAANSYGVESRFGPAAFVVGGADFAHIIWNSSRVVEVRDRMRRMGLTEGKLREELAPIEPLNHLPRRETTPTFVVAGKFDTVIPPADTQKLLGVLPDNQSLWLETGHYGGIFVQRRIQGLVSTFFADTFAAKPFIAPKGIYAPTVRIGVSGIYGDGMQVGLGVDLWRSRRDDFLGTVLATPKGVQIFLGARLDRGVSVGFFGSNRGVRIGAMWSTVL